MASGYMFSHYWPGDGVQGEQPTAAFIYGHPYWFDGSTFGFLGTPIEIPRHIKKRIRGWLIKNIWQRIPTRWIATYYVLRLIWGAGWRRADEIVREVAKDPSTRNLRWWGENDRLAVSNPIHGENVYRALAARIRLGGPDAATLAELAYLGVKKRGK